MNVDNTIISDRFKIESKIGSGSIYDVYKALDISRKPPNYIIVKILLNDLISNYLDDIIRFQNELLIISQLKHPNIIKIFGTGEFANNYYVAMELFEGITLDESLKQNNRYSNNDIIEIIIQISKALACVHKKNIIHKDLNPENILITQSNKNGHLIILSDFGFAYLKEYTKTQNQEILKTFYYMSPEYCNIIQKNVDERSDLYSLGILFYKLITGKYPFEGDSINSIIHQHIASLPETPLKFNPDVPKILEKIILKLLEKEPDKRYQTAEGLLYDLEKYKNGYDKFTIGMNDASIKLEFSRELVGREDEFQKLTNLYNEVKQGNGKICFISGHTGIGKTRIVEEFCEYILLNNGIYISGNVFTGENKAPYAIFTEALHAYLKIFDNYSPGRKEVIKEKLKKSVGLFGQIILQLNPSMARILEDCPALVELDTKKNNDRFNIVICNFFQALAEIENGIVFFIDDLHLAGKESIRILNNLMYEISDFPMLLLGNFRDDEITNEHILYKVEKEAINNKLPFKKINLKSFDLKKTTQFISILLHESEENILSVSKLIQDKSLGNPFFIIEILKQFISENVLFYKSNKWFINKQLIEKIEIPSNLLDIIVKRISLLNIDTIDVLSLAAIIGKRVDIKLLFDICSINKAKIVKIIDNAVFSHLVEQDKQEKGQIQFLHDRIREAFYKTIEEKRLKHIHLKIAEAIEVRNKGNIDNVVFDLIYHYNETDKKDKILLYAHMAAKKAKEKYSYDQAIKYYNFALNHLTKDNKETRQEWVNCITGLGDIYVIIGKSDKAIEMFNLALGYMTNKFEKTHAYKQISEAYYKKGDWKACENNSKIGLKFLNDRLYVKNIPVFLGIIKEFVMRNIHILFPIHRMRRKKNLKKDHLIVDYYYSLFMIYILSDALKTVRVSLRMLNLTETRLGKSKKLAISYMSLAIVCAAIPFFKKSLKYLEKSLALTEKLKENWGIGKTLQCLGLCYDWMGDYKKGVEYSIKSVEVFQKIGDITELYMSHSSVFHCYYMLGNYREALKANTEHMEISKRSKDNYGISIALNNKSQILICTGDYDNAEKYLIDAIQLSRQNAIWFVNCVSYKDFGILLLEKGDPKTAIEYLEKARELYEKYLFIKPYSVHLYSFLAEAYLMDFLDKKDYLNNIQKMKILKKIKLTCKKAISETKSWAAHYGVALRVKAKYYSSISKINKANKLFLQSIAHNKEYNLKYEFAKSLYEYGLHLKNISKDKKAVEIFKKSYQIFKEIQSEIYIEKIKNLMGISIDASPTQRLMDRQRLTSIMKMSQDISSILDIDTLLKSIIQKAIEVSGAQRGYLFIKNKPDNTLTMKAFKHIKNDSSIEYVHRIIHDVFKAGTTLIIKDVNIETNYQNNKDVKKYNLKSIICIPIIYRNTKVGVCYLDNPISTNVFSEVDAEILTVLMNQAAIAIENAELYSNSLSLLHKIHRLNDEKETQMQQLIQADKLSSLGTLASSIAHDITNPNSVILSNAAFLLGYQPHIFQILEEYYKNDNDTYIGNLPYQLFCEKYKQGLTGIVNCAKRIENIIGDLRNFYRKSESGCTELLNINKIIQSSIKLLSFELKKIVDKLHLSLDKNIPPTRGNYQHLEQVFVNIVLNACHAIRERGDDFLTEGKIIICTQYNSSEKIIKISITDNGIGMDKNTLEHITDPFFTTKTDKGGTGLGLNISERLIKEHNGKLSFTSEKGKGTTTEIIIPLNN